MDCTLNNNINNPCDRLHGGGIKDEIRLYKLKETKVVEDGLMINDIISDRHYLLFADALEYKQNEENGVYTHSLSGKVLNVSSEVQSNLFASKNDKYLVVFRQKGRNEINAFGVRFGAVVKVGETINTEESSFSIEISAKSDKPTYEVDRNAMEEYGKVYAKNFIPSTEQCEVVGDRQTGFLVANYMVAVNINGEPLDEEGMLCTESGRPQTAYKLQGMPIGGYHIEGDYVAGQVVNGNPTRRYDADTCENETEGTISLSNDNIIINTTNKKSQSVDIICADSWSVLDAYNVKYCSFSQTSGQGNKTITISDAVGGSEVVRIINNRTREIVQLSVVTYVVTAPGAYDNNGDMVFSIPVNAYGGSGRFEFESGISPAIADVEALSNSIQVSLNATPTADATYDIVVRHKDSAVERKTIRVTIRKAGDNEPNWVKVAQYCEIQ